MRASIFSILFVFLFLSELSAQESVLFGRNSIVGQYTEKVLTDVLKYKNNEDDEAGYVYLSGDSILFPIVSAETWVFYAEETDNNMVYTCRVRNGDQIAVITPKVFGIPMAEENKKYDMQLFSLKNLMKYNPGPWEWQERNRCIRNYYALEEDTILGNYMGDVYLCLMSQPKVSLGNDTSLINKKRGIPPF